MTARVTIIDDNGNPKGAYELKPTRIYEGGISTKYVFEFEYNQLNYDKYKAESEESFSDYPDMQYQFDNMTGSMNL